MRSDVVNPLAALLELRGVVVLDGALATELERAGCDLAHALWSARVLLDEPRRIAEVHRSYLEAGCDVIASASYQASVPGFIAEGLAQADAEALLRESIRLAARERDRFAEERGLEAAERPLVAASIGPYGAYLADGSEYRGDYDVTPAELERFHAERLQLIAGELAAGHADLVACETIPSLEEARLLARLLDGLGIPGWISFSCRDGAHTCEGQTVEECARALDAHEQVVAVGVNCTPPEHLPSLLERLRSATSKPLAAYPNSGETYDVRTHDWSGTNVLTDVDTSAARWHAAGATVLGGCCRTAPADIARLVAWRARA